MPLAARYSRGAMAWSTLCQRGSSQLHADGGRQRSHSGHERLDRAHAGREARDPRREGFPVAGVNGFADAADILQEVIGNRERLTVSVDLALKPLQYLRDSGVAP